MAKLKIDWRLDFQPVTCYAIGNVEPVIGACADKIVGVPAGVTHGLGALSYHGADQAGEGILFRGYVGVAPPVAGAGTNPNLAYGDSAGAVATPFCLSWSGEATSLARFADPAGVSLKKLYQEAISRVSAGMARQEEFVVLAEILGLLRLANIDDRALQKAVHEGNVRITDPEYAPDYFRFGIIREEQRKRGWKKKALMPLAIVGIGFQQRGERLSEKALALKKAVFYTPPPKPGEETAPEKKKPKSETMTHSHALGWKEAPQLKELLQQAGKAADWGAVSDKIDAESLPGLLAGKPDYVVHIDETSKLVAGLIRLYVVPIEQIKPLPVT